MAMKTEQEITVRVIGTNEELLNKLEEKGFEEKRRYALDDYYFIPKKTEIFKMSVRNFKRCCYISFYKRLRYNNPKNHF